MITVLYFLAGILAGGLMALCLLRNDKKTKDLEDKLAAKTSELERYEQQVVDHFAKTTDLLSDLQLQQDRVISHLADGAKQLRFGSSLNAVSALAIQGKTPELPKEYADVLSPIKWS